MNHDDIVAHRANHWDAVYVGHDEKAVSWFTERPTTTLSLLDAAGVDPGRSLVDVGAGASRLVDELLERGHCDVTALDVSGSGLAVARERLGGAGKQVSWVVADLLEWQPDRRFDVWHDRAVFHFLTDPADQARYRELLDTVLADDGIVVIGTFAEDGPAACSGLPTARYSADELLDTLGGIRRWTELGRRREHHITPSSVDQTFTWLALQRRPA